MLHALLVGICSDEWKTTEGSLDRGQRSMFIPRKHRKCIPWITVTPGSSCLIKLFSITFRRSTIPKDSLPKSTDPLLQRKKACHRPEYIASSIFLCIKVWYLCHPSLISWLIRDIKAKMAFQSITYGLRRPIFNEQVFDKNWSMDVNVHRPSVCLMVNGCES